MYAGAGNTLNIQRDLVQNGTTNANAGTMTWTTGTLRFFGVGTSSLMPNFTSSTNSIADVYNLTIDKATATDSVYINRQSTRNLKIAPAGSISVLKGVFDYKDSWLFLAPEAASSTGTFSVTSGAVVRTSASGNAWPLNSYTSGNPARNFATNTIAAGSVVDFYGAAQTIRGAGTNINSYGILILEGTGVKTLSGGAGMRRTRPMAVASAGSFSRERE